MSSPYAALVAKRARSWLRVLDSVEKTAARLQGRLGRATIILHGSYARGDFNLWSDIDLVIVSERFEGVRPLDRYELVSYLLEPGMEAVLLTPREAGEVLRRTGWRHALKYAVIVVDDYGLSELVERVSGVKPRTLNDLRRYVEKALEKALAQKPGGVEDQDWLSRC